MSPVSCVASQRRMLTGVSPVDQPTRRIRPAVRAGAVVLAALGAGSAWGDSSPLQRIAPGHWYEIPNSALRKVAPKPSVDGSVARITAWSGAGFDPKNRRLLIWGGGHGDYAGNEVYAFDLDTLAWTRLTEPARPDRNQADSYADQTPRSRHTYDYIEYVPELGRLVSFGGAALYPRGTASTRKIAEFDPQSRAWVQGQRRDVPPAGSMIGAHARVDPVSGDVFFIPSQRGALMRYSPKQDRWSGGWAKTYVRVHATAALDPHRRLMVLIGSGTEQPQAFKWNLDRGGPATDLRAVTTGDKEIERAYAPGFDFDEVSRNFVAWSGGTSVYVLDPDHWRWVRQPPATDNTADPGPQQASGTFGRFRYVPGLDVFVLMNGVDRNVFVYRLPAV